MIGTPEEYLLRMRQVLADPEGCGVSPAWLEGAITRKELAFDRAVSRGQDTPGLLMDEHWLAGMLGGMYTAITCMREPKFHAMVMDGSQCECGLDHPLVDVVQMVGNLLATMGAMLRQHDFRVGLDSLGVVEEGPAGSETEQ